MRDRRHTTSCPIKSVLPAPVQPSFPQATFVFYKSPSAFGHLLVPYYHNTMDNVAKDFQKDGQQGQAAKAHKIRITLTSRNVKNLEKGTSHHTPT